MAYNANNPSDTEYIAVAPSELRENFRALKDDKIVNAGQLNGLVNGNASGNIAVNNGAVCVNLNADKLDNNDASAFATVGHGHSLATSSSDGFYPNTHFQKVEGIQANAEVNQNSFSNILVKTTTIQADAKTDTFELVEGANITLTADATNDKVTIAVSGKVPSAAAADSATTATSATSATIATSATSAGTCTGNSATATKLATARTITLTGDATSSAVSFDGSANISITTTVGNDSHSHTTATLPAYPTTLPANGGDSDTVDSCHAGTSANNVLKLDASALVPIANIPSGIKTSGIAFCMVYPDDNQESPRYQLKANKTITGLTLITKTAPSASTTIEIYRNAVLMTSLALTTTSNSSTLSVTASAGDILYSKINGVANGLDLLTIELTVVDR